MKYIYTILLLSIAPLYILAQVPTNQDCMGAIPVCQNVYSQTNSYTGEGNYPTELPTTGGCPGNCLLSGEKNDVWYVFTVQQSGNLSFTITPTSTDDDYDWAVYNLTNASCSDILNNVTSLQVSCNYSLTAAPTGANGGSAFNCQDASGTPDNSVIPVVAGQTFVLNVSNFSSSQDGYSLDFGASTAVIFDNIPPFIHSLEAIPACGATTIEFSFSENVLCSTVSAADFTLNGPGGPYTVTNVTGYACGLGGTQEKTFTITVSPAITASGNYQLCLNDVPVAGSVTDLCGNVAPPDCLDFTIVNISTTMQQTDENCGAADGTATVSASGGSGNFTYTWSTTPPQSGATATGLSAGQYTVTVSDGACTAVDTVLISSIGGPTVTLVSMTPATTTMSNGSATVSASGGTPPYTYDWNSVPPQSGATVSNVPAGTYTVTVTDDNGCVSFLDVIITEDGSGAITVSAEPENCGQCNGQATVTVLTPIGNYTVLWSNGETTETITDLCSGNYTVSVTDQAETYVQSIFVPYIDGPTAAFTASPNPATFGEGPVFFVNQSIGATSYMWLFGDGQSSTDTSPFHLFPQVNEYTVWLYAYDDQGCVDSVSAIIIIRDIFTLYIPNAFTPNGDGINDVFMPYGMGIQPENYSLSIFDRYGKMIFKTVNINIPWDGNTGLEKQEEKRTNMYSYLLEFTDRDGLPFSKSGVIMLIY